ncbi:galactokinase [Streptomyces bohaiensis]|uniref:galactokinase n=1 Tax=Streptomyces bohaiensis TaxID=1431344 RepID=UPI003B7B3836
MTGRAGASHAAGGTPDPPRAPAELADAARQFFRARHGGPAAVVWTAPGRVNLIGEHTDYNGGLVLPLALPHRTAVAAAPRDDGLVVLHSAARGAAPVTVPLTAVRPGTPDGWAAYPAGVLAELRTIGAEFLGVSLAVVSDVPAGAGLSSSAALEVAAAGALADLAGIDADARTLAEIGRLAEHRYAGVPCGVMDQLAVACCRADHALLLDTDDGSLDHIPLDPGAAGTALLVVDTRVRHRLADGAYARRRAGCEEAARLLGAPDLRRLEERGGTAESLSADLPDALRPLVRHVMTENARVRRTARLLRSGSVRGIGPLLTAGHASLRDDFAVSCPEVDVVVAAAVAAGALGARMTGGGFGGSVVVLVETAAVPVVTEAVLAAARRSGQPEPRVFPATPAAGAARAPG